MPYQHKSHRQLAKRLAKLCRAFPQQRAALAATERKMTAISQELTKRLDAARKTIAGFVVHPNTPAPNSSDSIP